MLSPEAAQPMAIALHELVTNASKYGALTTPEGRISVRWSWRPDPPAQGRLSLKWIETGGPRVVVPSQTGYGTSAIRNLIPYELGGTVELLFDAGGLSCTIELPSKCVRSDARAASRISFSNAAPVPVAASSIASSR
jgi:two-component sensor histidine kinase